MFLQHLAEARGVWGPFLVVAPASTLHNWDRELQQFTPGFKVREAAATQCLFVSCLFVSIQLQQSSVKSCTTY